MKLGVVWITATLLISIGMPSYATLIDQGNGLIYDSDINLTWLYDPNYSMTSGYDADGLMTWDEAVTWVNNLSYQGHNDWRLPTTNQPDSACSIQNESGSYGYNCSGSEMGHLLFREFGGVVLGGYDPDLLLFQNLLGGFYWSATEQASNADAVWIFDFYNTYQIPYYREGNVFRAWAVADGNIASVPEPPSLILLASGVVCLIATTLSRRPASANRT